MNSLIHLREKNIRLNVAVRNKNSSEESKKPKWKLFIKLDHY